MKRKLQRFEALLFLKVKKDFSIRLLLERKLQANKDEQTVAYGLNGGIMSQGPNKTK